VFLGRGRWRPTAISRAEEMARKRRTGGPTAGESPFYGFLAAAGRDIESALWEQYAELGGADGGHRRLHAALPNLDGDCRQYISDNTDDEEKTPGVSKPISCPRAARGQPPSSGSGRLPSTRRGGQAQARVRT